MTTTDRLSSAALFDAHFSTLGGQISVCGYGIFEEVQNTTFMPDVKKSLREFAPDIMEVACYQGSDFFSAAGLSYTYGGAITYLLDKATERIFPDSGMSKFIKKNFGFISSTITFASIVGYEYSQSAGSHTPIDVPDIMAYAAGIETICHGKQVKNAISNLFANNKKAVAAKHFGDHENNIKPFSI